MKKNKKESRKQLKPKIINNIFEIEFLELIKIPQFFLYKIKIICNKKSIINPNQFNCNYAINCSFLNIKNIDNYNLLQEQELKKNEILETYIAFQKTEIATNQPTVSFTDFTDIERIKVKVRRIKEVEYDNSNRIYSNNKSFGI